MYLSCQKLSLLLLISFTIPLPFASGQVAVPTYHNDAARSGLNAQEAILTPANVNQSSFGKLFSYSLPGGDRNVYAKPLYLPNISIGGQLHNVLYIASEKDFVYAFDADTKLASPLWQADLAGRVGETPVSTSSTGPIPFANSMGEQLGITGTPVIDQSTGTLYVVAKTQQGSNVVDRLHALDVASGAEKFGGPVKIQATVAGSGTHSSNGQLSFDPVTSNQRSGLLLSNGVVYIAWGAFADVGPYHGWVMAYDVSTLQQLGIFTSTPNGGNFNCGVYEKGCDGKGGGIWTNGAMGADQDGNIYVGVGNGTFDASQRNYGESFVKLQPRALTLLDSFTPFNVDDLNAGDLDLGGGLTIVPDQPTGMPHLFIFAGKEGRIYVINRDNMGGFDSAGDHVPQESGPGAIGGTGCQGGSAETGCNRTTPAFWNNRVYFHGKDDVIKAFQLSATNPPLSTSPVASGTIVYTNPNNPETRGATPIISANGLSNGIAWDLRVDDASSNGGPAILYAYDALSLTRIYSTDQNSSRDSAAPSVSFVSPTVANGKVYVAGKGQVNVYGLLSAQTAQPPTVVLSTSPSSGRAPLTVTASTAGSSDPNTGGTIVSSWIDFGDGTVVNATTANHTYTSAGTYTVIATVYDNLGKSAGKTASVEVVLDQPPIAQLSVTPNRGNPPLEVTASTAGSSDPDGTITSTKIDFGDGTVVNAVSSQHSYSQSGKYTVTATVTDNDGLSSVASVIVRVGVVSSTVGDFDGDGKADLGTWRPNTGNWNVIDSSNSGVQTQQWGQSGDVLVPGDYDGDGKADFAVWRPSNGMFYVIRSSDRVIMSQLWGVAGDVPVVGDYDGDGKTDFAVWRPSNGMFYVIRSSDRVIVSQQWGMTGDIPVPGDYDGDGKTDYGVWRPSATTFYIIRSSDRVIMQHQLGTSSDIPVVGDYDGDGRTDFAVWRPSSGNWYVDLSKNATSQVVQQWGGTINGTQDIPVPADYDSDGRTDFAVWRPSNATFYIIRSSDQNIQQQPSGASGDVPVAAQVGSMH